MYRNIHFENPLKRYNTDPHQSEDLPGPKFDVIGTKYLINGMLVYQRTRHFLRCHLVGVNGVLSTEGTNKQGRDQTWKKMAHHLWLGIEGTGIYSISVLINFYTNRYNY